jgi:N-acetylmuramoyl-L-alanine amidase CwlA
MFRKKEYGRMYAGLKKTKLQRRLKARTKMCEGVAKMELDVQEGRAYSSGIGVEGDTEEDTEEGEPRARKRAKIAKGNNTLTGCKCGSLEHQRVSAKNCPWKGMSKKEIAVNYERRIEEMKQTTEAGSTETVSGEPTEESVQSTSKYLAPEV